MLLLCVEAVEALEMFNLVPDEVPNVCKVVEVLEEPQRALEEVVEEAL